MSAAFNAADWLERYQAAGGGWFIIGEDLTFNVLLERGGRSALPLMKELYGNVDRLDAVCELIWQREDARASISQLQ